LRTRDADIDDSLVTERLAATLATVFSFRRRCWRASGFMACWRTRWSAARARLGYAWPLGATRERVMRLLMREVLLPVTIGVAIALTVAWMLSK